VGDRKFRVELEKNKKRMDHVIKFNSYINKISGVHMFAPIALDTEIKLINRTKRSITKSYGADFVRHGIVLATTLGPAVAARLLGVNKDDVLNWMHSEEATIKEVRVDILNSFVSKSLDAMHTYLEMLTDKDKLKDAGTREIAYALDVVSSTAKEIVSEKWNDKIKEKEEEKNIVNKFSDAHNVHEITNNIVNVIINDPDKKKEVMTDILKRMNLYSSEPIPEAKLITEHSVIEYKGPKDNIMYMDKDIDNSYNLEQTIDDKLLLLDE
jgi:hypothetical protein